MTGVVTERRVATVIVGKELAGETQFTTVQAAVDYAVTQTPSATQPWTVQIFPGVYTENILLSSWVNLEGIGPPGSVVLVQLETLHLIRLATNVQVDNLTLRIASPAAGRFWIYDNGVACIARVSRCVFEEDTPGAGNHLVLNLSGASTIIVENCSGVLAGTGYVLDVTTATVRFSHCDFSAATVVFRLRGVATITCVGNRWNGAAALFSFSGASIVNFEGDSIQTSTFGVVGNGAVVTLRSCDIAPPVTAGNLGTIRLSECSYSAITRTGTGNIVDESPRLGDAPWKVHKWDWGPDLANAQIAVRGTPIDAGSGQVLLEVTDNAGDAEAVEQPADAAGALDSSFTPARTPRFITQVSIDALDPDVTMFFGLRKTLGVAVPAATEDHAGFTWDGTDFLASSDDGTAIQQTDLTNPSTGDLVQLEVIVFGGVTTVGWVEFYVDGELVATHVTRIPVDPLDWQHLLQTAGAGGGDVIQVTVKNGGCQECPA